MTTITDRTLEACSLRPSPWPPAPGTCVWCGDELVGRQRRWCAGACELTFTRNHQWGSARQAAVKRDGGACVKCGLNPEGDSTTIRLWGDFVDVVTCRPAVDWRDPATRWDHDRETFAAWKARRDAPQAPWIAAHAAVDRWVARRQLEVNHLVPILGRHGEFGCHHHLDGLETLCHTCHLQETARQFGHRATPTNQPNLFQDAS